MTKGIPLTPGEIEEYERVFLGVDNLGKDTDQDNGAQSLVNYGSAEQIPLFEEAI